MASINRYSQLTPATFNPLSVEEIMMVPLMKQKQHDMQQQTAMELGLFDVNRLTTDEDIVSENINKIQGGLQGIEDELFEKGTNRGVTRRLLDLKRERDKFLSNEGIGGRAQRAYDLYQQNVKDILSNKNMDPQDQQQALWYARNQYDQSGGVAKQAQYNPYLGFDSINLNEKLTEYGKVLDPIIRQTSGWYKDPDDPGMWRKGSEKTTQLPLEVIQKALAHAASSDTELINYLREKSRITPGFNPSEALINSIEGVSPLFIRDDREYDSNIRFDTRDKEDKGNGRFGFDVYADVISPVEQLYLPENLDPKPAMARDKSGSSANPLGATRGSALGSRKGFDKNTVLTQRYTEIGKKLIGNNFDIDNDKHRAVLKKYITEVGPHAGNQNISVIDPTTMSLGEVAEAVTKDRSKFVEQTNRLFTGVGTKFMVNGKFYNSRVQMLKELGLDPEEVLEVHDAGGIVDWDNNLRLNLKKGEEQWADDFAEPVMGSLMVKGNAVPIYMSRKEGDLGGSPKIKKAHISLNRDVSKMKMTPGLPEKVEIWGEDDKVHKVDMRWLPTEGGGGVFAYESDDGIDYITKEELQANRYAVHGIKVKQPTE